MAGVFEQPALLVLLPAALVALYLLERWRRRPVRVVVADLSLFETSPEVEAEAKARRRRLDLRWLLRALAAVCLALAAAGAQLPPGPGGAVTVDLVLDRGLSAGFAEGEGLRLDQHARHLQQVVDALRPDDRVLLHLVPGPRARLQSPAEATAALKSCRPTAALADLETTLAHLVPGAARRPPVFVATDREFEGWRQGIAVALAGSPKPNRGIVALTRGVDGALHVTLASSEAPGPVDVVLACGEGEALVTKTLRVELPARGLARAAWSLADGFPEDAAVVSARLEPGDALRTDDVAFAVLAAAPPRRVGVVGDPGPDVLRALRSVDGVALERLSAMPSLERQASLALLVAPKLPAGSTQTALVVVPSGPSPTGALPGGSLSASGLRGVFPYTTKALDAEPQAHASEVAPLPASLESFEPLIRAGTAPYLVVSGRGRRLVAVAAAPLRRTTTNWPLGRSFPVFWAELLEEVAPRQGARLEAHTCGDPLPAGSPVADVPLSVLRVRGAGGRPVLGTVAALLKPRVFAEPRAFAPGDLAKIEAARPQAQPWSLAPILAGLALLLTLASWTPKAQTLRPRGLVTSPDSKGRGEGS